jgi:sirohydrochlorin cobaltochelatase
VQCESQEAAAWLQFAVTAENVSARRRETVLQLPAGPGFRVEKEIKNVVVALAKAYHYWDGHLTNAQQSLAGESVWEPATPTEASANPAEYEAAVVEVENALREAGRPALPRRSVGWIGVETAGEEDAVWLLRAVLAEQVLARREGKVLYLPVGSTPGGDQSARVGRAFSRAWYLWTASEARRPTC